MYNNGCIMVLLSSVKRIQADIEKSKERMESADYADAKRELDSMERFLQSMLDGKRA